MPPAPLLDAAPPWGPDRSEYVVLWHGCTLLAKDDIEARGIDLGRCAPDTDFGRGFYTTTLERQARLWAWEQEQRWIDSHPRGPANPAVVLRLRVRRYTRPGATSPLDDGLDRLDTLAFARGDFEYEDFWSLVQHCRRSVPGNPLAGIAEVVNDHLRPPTGWYQMVCGPVAAFWTQRAMMAGSDQYSFHEGGT